MNENLTQIFSYEILQQLKSDVPRGGFANQAVAKVVSDALISVNLCLVKSEEVMPKI